MKHIYKLKIYFLFLISLLFWYSCAGNKPNETENHPEIEKLWIEYFNNLNDNKLIFLSLRFCPKFCFQIFQILT